MQWGRTKGRWYKHGLAMDVLSVVEFCQYLQVQIYRGGQEHRSLHLLVLAAALETGYAQHYIAISPWHLGHRRQM